MTAHVRLVVADHNPLVRAGLRAVLATEPGLDVVAEAADGVEAVDAVRAHRPDVVLMDVRMPRLDGIAATRAVLAPAGRLTTRVLVLTTFDVDDHVLDALRAGASGYLLKDAPAEQLVAAVRAVAAGDAALAPSVTRRLLDRMTAVRPPAAAEPVRASQNTQDVQAGAPAADALRALLSARELEVLLLLARGLSNAEIAAALVVSETTVKSHVQGVLTKLGVRDRLQAAVTAYRSGLAGR